jgi:hypothetical protein
MVFIRSDAFVKEDVRSKNTPLLLLSSLTVDCHTLRHGTAGPYIKKTNADLSFGEVTKLCGIGWQALSIEDKQPYQDAYKVDKDKYDVVMAEYKKKLAAAAE